MIGLLISGIATLLIAFNSEKTFLMAWEETFEFLKYWYGLSGTLFAIPFLASLICTLTDLSKDPRENRGRFYMSFGFFCASLMEWFSFIGINGIDSAIKDGQVMKQSHLELGLLFLAVSVVPTVFMFLLFVDARKTYLEISKEKTELSSEIEKPIFEEV